MGVIKSTIMGLLFGTFGTIMGGVIGIKIKNNSNKVISSFLSLSAGIMTSITCFDLIPQSIKIDGMPTAIISIFVGILFMFITDYIVNKKINKKITKKENKKISLLKSGIIIAIGIGLHNIPEGLAIGSGLNASLKLGISLAIAILIHDIPEGISMAIPMKVGGINSLKILMYIFLSGVLTGVGSLVGSIVGKISNTMISMCLGISAGAMLYIISGELVPQYNELYKGKLPVIINIIGFILGIIVVKI